MTRYTRFISVLIVVIMFYCRGSAQNLYDLAHSQAFAQYLYSSQQYHLAAMELERVVFMEPENHKAKHQLITAYRKANEWDAGINRILSWYPQGTPDSTLSREWIRLLLLNHEFIEARSYLANQPELPKPAISYYSFATSMLSSNFKAAELQLENDNNTGFADNNSSFRELKSLLEQQQSYRYKSPGLALGLSAIIPGLGKVYTKDWKDGLISLLFVATNTWQAYRGFSKDGIQSAYGWIFGTMAVGFYGSSLYGGWKSAVDYNSRLNNNLHHEIEAAVYNRF